MAKNEKLHNFVMAALTNPRHPLYQFNQAKLLQQYAVNVKGCGLFETLTPEEWERDYPREAAKLVEVMALCEADQAADTAQQTAQAELARKLKEAEDKLATQATELAALKAAAAPPAT